MSFISKNFEIIPKDSARIRAVSSVLLYGYGTFTTIAVYNGKPFQWELHLQRLKNATEKLNIKFSIEGERLKQEVLKLIEKNKIENGRVRITIFEEEIEGLWRENEVRQTSVLITTATAKTLTEEFRLNISTSKVNSTSLLKGIKSCNYLENLLALQLARSGGFDEAVRLNERGEVTSACMANLFWITDDTVFTPSLDTGCLDGTTRNFVINLCRELGLEVYTAEANLEELLSSDEVFLTSAGIGIKSVRRISDTYFDSRKTSQIKLEFLKKIATL
ncbi:MAG: aminotransferase class IV [Pyrinomonadaceae bacterium]|nr:aminotransferase class IV [Pyrinomonadaceae bacterium]MCX7639015.1 aminotransferase class IV [Pyrinomonadaceae bacterium]MDW8303765.1 aminotransferase class IV [Acidobacteriota bacterium]